MYDHERSLVKELKDKPFALVGVNYNDELETIQKVTKEKNLIWRSFFAGDSTEIFDDYEIEFFPTVMILDAKGVIHSVGSQPADHVIHELLAEME